MPQDLPWEQRVAAANRRVEDAVSEALNDLGLVPLKFVASFEYMDYEGERGVASFASPGIMKWDVHGLLDHVLRRDNLDTLSQLIQQAGDDD
jgi:hypothetical protein